MGQGEYRPYQHKAKPIGCEHETIFASVELWTDNPPEAIALGEFRYVLEEKEENGQKVVDKSNTIH